MTQLELFSGHSPELPPYQVRESARAKHVSIKISVQGDVEVVVPSRFDRAQLPAILAKRRDWILRSQAKLLKDQAHLDDHWQQQRPEALEFRWQSPVQQAHPCETWQVIYEATGSTGALCLPIPGNRLKVRGDVDNLSLCQQVLQKWLTHKAHKELVPWLRQLSFDLDLPFKRASVRGQKTRWGSCSSRKDISLNYKLLFLPAELVEYVLVHELCHTRHMNHSRQFWQLVDKKLPGYEPWRQALKTGWQYVPRWVEAEAE
jgi:hypothetical protein